MGLFYYVIDTGINSIRNGQSVAVGQSTYDLLVEEKFNHGVIPLGDGVVGGGNTFAYTPLDGGTQIGIHTTKNVGRFCFCWCCNCWCRNFWWNI